MEIDTLITARWVIPVHPAGVLPHHAVAIQAGRIIDVLPTAQAQAKYQPQQCYDCDQHALMPGLINGHTHVAMNLFKGIADDLPLKRWLEEHIWPAEGRWLTKQFVRDGSNLAIAEMLRGGTTTFNDMYLFPDVTAQCALQAGMRAVIGMVVIDFPTAWAKDADEYLRKGLALYDQYKDEQLLGFTLAPHAPYTVSPPVLARIARLSNELDMNIHMHIHETADEVAQAVATNGQRPLFDLDQLGLLTSGLQAVHMTQLQENELSLLAERSINVMHCPESNMKLASGICPVSSLLNHGVNVSLGTDGAASNNDLDMFSEMRSAAFLAKVSTGDAMVLPADTVLEMATINGAKALGIDRVTGSIESGKAADLIAVNLAEIENQPLYNPISQLVYSCGRESVEHVWVAGRQLLHQRRLTTLNESDLLACANEWQEKM